MFFRESAITSEIEVNVETSSTYELDDGVPLREAVLVKSADKATSTDTLETLNSERYVIAVL